MLGLAPPVLARVSGLHNFRPKNKGADMRRVVVTGLGMVTPLAASVEETWSRLLAGNSGAGPITHFDAEGFGTGYACEVKRGDGTNGTFNPDDWMEPKDQRKVDAFILYGIAAATQAVEDSGWVPEDPELQNRAGVLIGSGIGGLTWIEKTSQLIAERGPRRVSPFFIPGSLINLVSGQVSIEYGFKGPNHAVVTACSTGAHAIGDAARLIKWGDADVMVAGGTESPICPSGVAGFNACKALSTKWADEPHRASRPYDADRDGFVMGEGAGMVVLEEYEHSCSWRKDLCGSPGLWSFRGRVPHHGAERRRGWRAPFNGSCAKERQYCSVRC